MVYTSGILSRTLIGQGEWFIRQEFCQVLLFKGSGLKN